MQFNDLMSWEWLFGKKTDAPTKHETRVFDRFAKETIPHTRGYYILAPSGSGKTHYVQHQKERHWIDGDDLWTATGAEPDYEWWNASSKVIWKIEEACDHVTEEAKKRGLWIIGASQATIVPDAIVLPPREKNIAFIKARQEGKYDGGYTTDNLDQLDSDRTAALKLAKERSIPVFASIEEAHEYISAKHVRALIA